MSDQDPAYDWAREHLNRESAKMSNTAPKKSDSWIFYIVGGVIASLIILWILAIILTKPKKTNNIPGEVREDEYSNAIQKEEVPVASGDE